MTSTAKCALCGEPMPGGEEMFKYHGYSGPCPKPPSRAAGAPAAPADAPPSERQAPKRIWLQWPGSEFDERATWCSDKVNDDDVEYMRAASPEPAAGEPQTYDRGGLFVGAPDVREAVQSIARCLAFSPGDQSLNKRSAWVYGIVLGWDDALPEVAARHRWSPEDVARLERLHKAWAALSQQGPTGEAE